MDTYRDVVLNALDIYSKENTNLLFLKAVRLLGFPGSAADRDTIDSIVDSARDISVFLKEIPLDFDSHKLYPSIRSTIAAYKDKPAELEFFICDIIAKFNGISRYLYPIPASGDYDTQVAAFTLWNTTQHYHPADSVLNEWRKYERRCNPSLSDEGIERAVNYRLELFQKFIDSDYYRYVFATYNTLRYVASLIDAALLECGYDQDYFYFQKSANSVLTYELDSIDLYSSSGVNPERIKKKWFDRCFYQDVAPSGLLLWDFRDEVAEYRSTGVWNMTRELYTKVIAAPNDIRKANLNTYLSCYKDYVYLLNEDQSIREMSAVFYDLYELWGEVTFFLKNDTFAPHPCREMVKLLREQFVHHLAYAYFIYLINSKTSWFDIYSLYPGVKKEEVEDFLCEEFHFLSHEDFAKYEKELPSIGKRYEPFPGFYPKEVSVPTNKPVIVDPVSSPKLGDREYTELSVIYKGKPDTIDSLNLIELCGVYEIDRLFVLDLQDNPVYTNDDFYPDLASFSKKCTRIAESDISVKRKETWIARVLDVLLESYCFYDYGEKKKFLPYVIQFAAKMDEIFMKVPEQICVRRIAQEVGDPLIFEHLDPNIPEEGRKNREEDGLEMPTWEDGIIFENIGSSMIYHQRRMCRDCKEKKCRFRFGLKKYYADVDYGFGNPELEIKDANAAEPNDETPQIVSIPSEPIDYIKDCHKTLCSEEVDIFLNCVSLYLTITPPWDVNYTVENELEDFINEHLTPPWSLYYQKASELSEQLAQKIKSLKDDELELSNFIDGFLSPFYDIAWSLRPFCNAHADYLSLITLVCAGEFNHCTLDEYKAHLAASIDAVPYKQLANKKECYLYMLKNLLERIPERTGDEENPTMGAIRLLYCSLNHVEGALESALLKAGVKNDYLYYEDEVGIDLGQDIDYMSLTFITNLTPHVLSSRIKKFGHRTELDTSKRENTITYLERVIRSVNDEGEEYTSAELPNNTPNQQVTISNPTQDVQLESKSCQFPPDKVGELVLSSRMKDYLSKASAYFVNGKWYNTDRKEYSVFLKTLYYKVHRKDWGSYVSWAKIPIFPLSDGTVLTVDQLKGAFKGYDEIDDIDMRKDFEKMLTI